MMRSFALTFAAVTLRLYLIPVGAFDLPFAPFYTAIAWVSWVPNILAVEVWLRLRRRGRPAAA